MANLYTTKSDIQAQVKVLTAAFYDEADNITPLWSLVFDEPTVDKKRSVLTIMQRAGLGTLQTKKEGQAPIYDAPYELTSMTATFFTTALAVKNTEEAELEDIDDVLGDIPAQLAKASRDSKDLTVWNTLNLGFSPQAPYQDGQPLFSAAHPLSPIAGPTGLYSNMNATQSNFIGATALSPESLQQVRVLMATMVTERGRPDSRTPVTLMVPPVMDKIAKEITGSSHVPFSADNQINVLKDALQVLTNRYLTSNSAWFVLGNKGPAFKAGDHHHLFVAHKWNARYRAWDDGETGNLSQKVSDRYTYGAASWKGVVGSQGASGNI